MEACSPHEKIDIARSSGETRVDLDQLFASKAVAHIRGQSQLELRIRGGFAQERHAF
jgi:hypothetical protein